MKVVDFNMDLHVECRSPFIRFMMQGDKSIYMLMAYEYNGCHKDDYIVEVFGSPERAWDALQKLLEVIVKHPLDNDTSVWQWNDDLTCFWQIEVDS